MGERGGGCQNVAPGQPAGVGGGKSVALTSSWARMATTLSLGWQLHSPVWGPSEYIPEKRCNTWPKPRKEQKFANCFQLRIHLEVESHPMVVGWTSAPMGITVVFLVVLECAGSILGCTGVHHGVCPGVHRWASAEGASPPMNRCTGPGGSSHASNHWPLLPLLGGK